MKTKEELIRIMTEAGNLEVKRQLCGQDLPPKELYDPTSWSATGGELDLSKVAQAALEALCKALPEADLKSEPRDVPTEKLINGMLAGEFYHQLRGYGDE